VRAVGAANGRTPIAIVAPCHCVIGVSGALTGFAGGLEVKRYLLDPEANGLRGAHPVPSMAKELPDLALEQLTSEEAGISLPIGAKPNSRSDVRKTLHSWSAHCDHQAAATPRFCKRALVARSYLAVSRSAFATTIAPTGVDRISGALLGESPFSDPACPGTF
jgi:hypothetical protein